MLPWSSCSWGKEGDRTGEVGAEKGSSWAHEGAAVATG